MLKKLLPGLVLAIFGAYLVINGVGQKIRTDSSQDSLQIPLNDQSSNTSLALIESSDSIPTELSDHERTSETDSAGKHDMGDNADYKLRLLDKLTRDNWSKAEINTIVKLLSDPRSQFLPKELETNITHEETAKLYENNYTQASIKICEDFWRDNRTLVLNGAGESDVPLSIIVSIMFVETKLGRVTGDQLVFNVFWSLAVADDPDVMSEFLKKTDINNSESREKLTKRSAWGRRELRELVAISMDDDLDPMQLKGSWAGAFGLCQFLPSSFRNFSRDGNGDGIIDLFNIEDASASIANYLSANGWRADGTREQQKKTIMRYNASNPYVDCVLTLSDKLKARIKDLQH